MTPEEEEALALWREEVTNKKTILGFSDWLSWRSTTDQGDKDE